MANKQTRVIIILSAVLIAAALVSALVLSLLPSQSQPTGPSSPLPGELSEDSTSGFNLQFLQTASYLSLDKQLIISGALPVQPPAATGKANPFL
ncbi:MAG: hypothetical protein WEA04_04485 [Candidatus Andersenbacteria bacterium]